MITLSFLHSVFIKYVISGIIENHGSTMNNLLSVCMYIRDMADYPRINTIYGQYFGLNPPVRVCVQAPINCYAMIESVAARFDDGKRTLHVQSVSHWAPANIGPYSQCVQVNNDMVILFKCLLITLNLKIRKQ